MVQHNSSAGMQQQQQQQQQQQISPQNRPPSPTIIEPDAFDERIERLHGKLARLDKGTLPDYQRGVARIETECKDRQLAAKEWYQLQCQLIDQEHSQENCSAQRELDSKRKELSELLLKEIADKRRTIEQERNNFDLNFDGDVADVKQPATRKLRRRQAAAATAAAIVDTDIVGTAGAVSDISSCLLADKSDSGNCSLQLGMSWRMGRKPIAASAAAAAAAAAAAVVAGVDNDASIDASAAPAAAAAVAAAAPASSSSSLYSWPICSINPMLSEADILQDCKFISRNCVAYNSSANYNGSSSNSNKSRPAAGGVGANVSSSSSSSSLQVVDDVLFYRNRCFQRGTPVIVCASDGAKFHAVVTEVTQMELFLKRISDNGKVKITMKHLRIGKYFLKRKS